MRRSRCGWRKRARTSALSFLANELVRAIRESAQQNAAHAGDQITARNLDVQPTIRVRPGWPVRVLVSKDLVLRPWSG
jgi:type IV secretion system protein VirB10